MRFAQMWGLAPADNRVVAREPMLAPIAKKDSPMWNRESAVKRDVTKDPAMVQPATFALPAEERKAVAWVGRSVIFKGTLVSSEELMIDGRVEGTIEVRDQNLTIGPNADIRAEIVASRVTIHGIVVGNIRADAKVDVSATGQIEGNLSAPRIAIADGAVVCGRIDTLSDAAEATDTRARLAAV